MPFVIIHRLRRGIPCRLAASTQLPPGAQVLASAFQDYPIWAYIQPREDLRRKLLTWVLKRYMRGILAKSRLRQGCVYAVRDGTDDSLAGVILLWRPSTAGEAACLACCYGGLASCCGVALQPSHAYHTSVRPFACSWGVRSNVSSGGVPDATGTGSMELPPWQVVRQGLLALPFRFGAAVTHRLLQVRFLLGKQRLSVQ